MSKSPEPAPVIIAGCTASGKSATAMELARRLDGEIISVDSMQVYRGLDIGTAKPSLDERAAIPHHLIDVVEPDEPFDAAKFISLAAKAEAEMRARGKTPVYCGGTGFYFSALHHGLGESPPSEAALRDELLAIPLPVLLEELQKTDPATYDSIDRQNPRRVVRALQVIHGCPFSDQRADWENRPPMKNLFVLERHPDDLLNRINRRVEQMFDQGLVQEVAALMKKGLSENPYATQAIGYRQVLEHLQGARDLKETIELVKMRTRQFAKRQRTWFRHQLKGTIVTIDRDEKPAVTAERILKALK